VWGDACLFSCGILGILKSLEIFVGGKGLLGVVWELTRKAGFAVLEFVGWE